MLRLISLVDYLKPAKPAKSTHWPGYLDSGRGSGRQKKSIASKSRVAQSTSYSPGVTQSSAQPSRAIADQELYVLRGASWCFKSWQGQNCLSISYFAVNASFVR